MGGIFAAKYVGNYGIGLHMCMSHFLGLPGYAQSIVKPAEPFAQMHDNQK